MTEISGPSPEQKAAVEPVPLFVDYLEEVLPWTELTGSFALRQVRSEVLTALEQHNPDLEDAAWREYQAVYVPLIDILDQGGKPPERRAELQVAQQVHEALILLQAGRIDEYKARIAQAEYLADTSGLRDAADLLYSELMRLGIPQLKPEDI